MAPGTCSTNVLTGDTQRSRDGRATRDPARILIVDNDPDIRALITDSVRDVGYETIEATCSAHATRIMDDLDPDLCLVLLDPWHAEKESIQFARYLKERGTVAPIVVFSDWYDSDRSIAQIGAVDILTRAFAIGDLLHIVGKFARTVA